MVLCVEEGRLGHGNEEQIMEPQQIRSLEGQFVVDIAAGSAHSLISTRSGQVYSFGTDILSSSHSSGLD